jgi:hypothetical protein
MTNIVSRERQESYVGSARLVGVSWQPLIEILRLVLRVHLPWRLILLSMKSQPQAYGAPGSKTDPKAFL